MKARPCAEALRRSAVAGALAVMAGGCSGGTQTDGSTPFHRRDQRPGTLGYHWVIGERATYRIRYSSKGEYDLAKLFRSATPAAGESLAQPSLLAGTFETSVEGELRRTVVTIRADTVVVSYQLAPHVVWFVANGDSSAVQRAALAADLGREIFAALDRDGRVLLVRFDPSLASSSQAYVRAILGIAQVVVPSGSAMLPGGWTIEETDPTGRYVATYDALPAASPTRAGVAPEVWRVTKRKQRYAPPDSVAPGFTRRLPGVIQPSGALTAHVDVRRGVLLSLAGTDVQVTQLGDRVIARAESAVDAALIRQERLIPTDLAAVGARLRAREQEATAVPLAVARPAAEVEAELRRATLGRATLDSLLAALAASDSSDGSAAATTPIYLKVKAYAYLHPEAADTFAALLRRGDPSSVSVRTLAGALGAAGTPAAQAALAAAIEARIGEPAALLLLVPILGSVQDPTERGLRALRTVAERSTDQSVVSSAVLGVGAMSRLVRAPRPHLADTLTAWLHRGLRGARSWQARALWLDALGNAGASASFAAIAAAATDSSSAVRGAAVYALRWLDTSLADSALIRALRTDADPLVRVRAAAALSARPVNRATVGAQLELFGSDSSEMVRLRVLRNLWRARAIAPDAERVVRAAARSDPSDQVRGLARRLIEGSPGGPWDGPS